MCGIAGLFLKEETLEPELGSILAGMLGILSDRGPDSAGFAVYRAETPGTTKLSVLVPDTQPVEAVADEVRAGLGEGARVEAVGSALLVSVRQGEEEACRAAIAATVPDASIIGTGARMEVYKAVGEPSLVSGRFGLAAMSGTHAVGHTRMATESAVTTNGAHPFSTGRDQCLVHNGSLSNHNLMRRRLKKRGIEVETENDSEVAAAYLTWRLREGASLREALEASLHDLDGFFTFVVGTESGFAVLRDPIACKPAVMAETDAYVAFGSEYRALADLPDIADARVWEPEPATVYSWERH